MKKVNYFLKIFFYSIWINFLVAFENEMIFPNSLEIGDTIAFCAPAAYLDQERIFLAKQRLENRGFKVIISDSLFRRYGYLAGTDKQRATELMNYFLDKRIKAIFPGTGGYGSTRILELLDYNIIRNNPKIFIGYSDITALHIAINQLSGLITFHTPNPMYGLGSPNGMDKIADKYFWEILENNKFKRIPFDSPEDGFDISILVQGKGKGKLIGGNLSLICGTMGSDFEINTSEKILFIEDVGEAPYRIDRYLQELKLARKFESINGAILGQFTRRSHEPQDDINDFKMEEVLEHYFADLKIPVIKNFPAGHIKKNISLPMGAIIEIDTYIRQIKLIE